MKLLQILAENSDYSKVELIELFDNLFSEEDLDYIEDVADYMEDIRFEDDIDTIWCELMLIYIKYVSENRGFGLILHELNDCNYDLDYTSGECHINLYDEDEDEEDSYNNKLVSEIDEFNNLTILSITYN